MATVMLLGSAAILAAQQAEFNRLSREQHIMDTTRVIIKKIGYTNSNTSIVINNVAYVSQLKNIDNKYNIYVFLENKRSAHLITYLESVGKTVIKFAYNNNGCDQFYKFMEKSVNESIIIITTNILTHRFLNIYYFRKYNYFFLTIKKTYNPYHPIVQGDTRFIKYVRILDNDHFYFCKLVDMFGFTISSANKWLKIKDIKKNRYLVTTINITYKLLEDKFNRSHDVHFKYMLRRPLINKYIFANFIKNIDGPIIFVNGRSTKNKGYVLEFNKCTNNSKQIINFKTQKKPLEDPKIIIYDSNFNASILKNYIDNDTIIMESKWHYSKTKKRAIKWLQLQKNII